MKVPEQAARRAVTIMGRLNDPGAERAIAFAMQDRPVWWHLWNLISHPRAVWLGFTDQLRHPENYR